MSPLGATQPGPIVKPDSAAPIPTLPASAFPVMNWERYEFIKPIGQGAMGTVYMAHDRKLDRTVALKFIRGRDSRLFERLQQEARVQARVDHPSICKVPEVCRPSRQFFAALAGFLFGGAHKSRQESGDCRAAP